MSGDSPLAGSELSDPVQSLQEAVSAVFGEHGPLAEAAETFCPREGQTRMAQAVARVVAGGGVLVAEAATGVGKTFAYLVPALLSGERVLISTATKTLQDQLFGRDLPALAKSLGLPVRMALLKGRGSYLCLHRLEAAPQAIAHERGLQHALSKIERWAHSTRTGDLAELPGLHENSPVIPLVTSTRENCLGAECPKWRACHVNLARREAMAADVVVVNHHLFFADLAIRESGMAELLPTVRVVIFDEAHQLNETGIQFLGQHLGTAQLLDFSRDLLGAGLQQARGLADWSLLANGVEMAARDMRMAFGANRLSSRLRWVDEMPEGIDPGEWRQTLASLGEALAQAAEGLDNVSEISPDFVRLHERAMLLCERVARFAGACEPGAVRWADVGNQLRLMESPLDIADVVRKRLLGAPAGEEPAEAGQSRAWVFVSATLGDDANLTWFTGPCGLSGAEILRVGSPFDYERQATLYVPRQIVKPNDPAHGAQVAQIAGDAAERLGGRTMVLTTTLRALRVIGEKLAERFEGTRVEVLVQGQLPKRVLMERFRAGNSQGPGQGGSVLVASASFWEGVDLPGDTLQAVVIDKLPFPPPGDPLVEARCRRIEAEGRSAFADYSIPEAAVALKQGAGRLIRRETDTGMLVICDTRLTSMGYGKRLLAALPPMRRLTDEASFHEALEGLVKPDLEAGVTFDV
ncbi:ATP-dependent DNA helicase [Ottowia thiooxydans]|uniref:ATP-dependent DNA helicase n=1 Tax=Ottowia thiooxydans TaxID=219182 RepID=UPI000411444F|nr:ATP-dependent DNA helicase [Ottowia thiooxydans]